MTTSVSVYGALMAPAFGISDSPFSFPPPPPFFLPPWSMTGPFLKPQLGVGHKDAARQNMAQAEASMQGARLLFCSYDCATHSFAAGPLFTSPWDSITVLKCSPLKQAHEFSSRQSVLSALTDLTSERRRRAVEEML